MVAQKNLKSSKNYPYLISPYNKTAEKTCSSAQKGTISAKSAESEKGRETLSLGVYGSAVKKLTFGPKNCS